MEKLNVTLAEIMFKINIVDVLRRTRRLNKRKYKSFVTNIHVLVHGY